MRMALSQDWSGLDKYLGESLRILPHSIALDAVGILSLLRCPAAPGLLSPRSRSSCRPCIRVLTLLRQSPEHQDVYFGPGFTLLPILG